MKVSRDYSKYHDPVIEDYCDYREFDLLVQPQ